MLTVKDIMTPSVVTIGPEATIGDAIDLLIGRNVAGLLVIDAQGALVGILTEFALLALAYDHEIAGQTVDEHMTREVLTVDAAEGVNKVADLCIVHRVRRLPVIENGKLVGLVSRRDVLDALYNAKAPAAAL